MTRLPPLPLVGALVGIVVAAFNLRIAVVSVGPVLEDIRADTGMSSAMAGVLTTIPFICMGLFATAGEPVIRRLGRNRAVTVALALMAVGTLVRAPQTSPLMLLLLTIPSAVGIAIANAAIPAVVKDRFPDRPGLVTGAYVASLSVGSTVVTAGVVPLSDAVGGWQWGLGLTAVPAIVAIVVWIATRAGVGEAGAGAGADWSGSRQWRVAVLLGLTFAFQCICYAAMVSWGPAVFEDAGFSSTTAAYVIGMLPLMTMVAALVAPVWSDGRDRRPWVFGAATLQTIGMVTIALVPDAAPWLWISIFGLGNGAIFALVLTFPLDFGRDPGEVAWIASWALAIGFLISALSPPLVGALRDLTGGFAVPFAVIGLAGFAAGPVAMRLRRQPAVQRG